MGDEEKRARLFLNDLERIVIRYKPLLDLASEDGREKTYKDFYSLLAVSYTDLTLPTKG